MASIKVTYIQSRVLTQTINWPDDELEGFNLENLLCNLDPEESQENGAEIDITRVTKDGERHEF